VQVVIENKQNLDFQPPQQQVVSNAELKQYRVDSIKKQHKCNTCDYRFLYPYQLKNHIAKHTGNEKYECNIDKCKKKFLSLKSFKNHKESHGVFLNYACSICNITFANQKTLTIHNSKSKQHLTLVSLKHNKYTCDICPETFSSKHKKAYHCSRRHPEYKPYTCSACNKRFVTLQVQKRHDKIIHNNKTQAKYKNEDKALELADKSLPSILSVEDINNTNSSQYLGGVTQLDMTSIEETINEDNNQYQLSEWSDDCQSDIESEEDFINENDIGDINDNINELKQMMGLNGT
jgi:transcriptional regulator NrdR family protein